MQVSKPGSICWAAFLEMGARHENSPTMLLLYSYATACNN